MIGGESVAPASESRSRAHLVLDHRRDRLQLRKAFTRDCAWRAFEALAEAVDEGLQMLALGLLLLGPLLASQRLLLGALALERRVAAAIER